MKGLKYQEEEDPQLLDTLTQGTSAQQMTPTPPTMAPPSIPLAPKPQVQQPVPVAPPPQNLPGMPPSVTADELQGYLGKQRQAVGRYGPEEQMAMQKNIEDTRNSLGSRLTSGAKGFADAIMMGVAGAGNPGWQQAYDSRQDQLGRDKLANLESARGANLKNVEAGMSLDKMDPNSPLSKTAQETYSPLFEKLGYPPSKLQGMSAANIDSTLALMTQFGGMEIQAAIKQYELEIERARLGAANAKATAEERTSKRAQNIGIAKDLSGQKDNLRVGGIPIPFTKGTTKESEMGTKYLAEELSGGTAEQNSTEDQEALQWANANPDDPRAKEIKSRLGQ